MKNKILNILYCVIFMTVVIVPALLTNTKTNQISMIDNKALTEWPEIDWKLTNREQVENYVDDRIGFRELVINSYIELNDELFSVMVHPLFMYGKDGHIFYKDPDYIAAYQHLNTNTQMLDSFVVFLTQTQDYLTQKGIPFLYFACPDKKTIYSEYFPDTINVNEQNISVTDYLKERLADTDVNYIMPIDELLTAKQDRTVYNKKYDATHWNEFGAMTAHKLIDGQIQTWFDDVPVLTEDNYDLEFIQVDSLDIAKFPIDEQVPVYSLKQDTSGDATEYLISYLDGYTNTFYSHYMNETAPNNRILLVFVDSYFGSYQKYYNNRFKEVYFVHRQNYDYLQYYVNLFFPDAVIFETAERSISSEMPLLADFTNYIYEPPYTEEERSTGTKALKSSIYEVNGARLEDQKLYLPQNDTSAIVSMKGIYSCKDADLSGIHIYAHAGEKYLETDYCKQERDAKEAGDHRFSVNIQRRYLAEGTIELIAVDETTNEEYHLQTIEVVYE
ncbi:MAG: hypothetical protein Q4G60_01045 [bacterium]|nr:hypothetical protein [bacterium]